MGSQAPRFHNLVLHILRQLIVHLLLFAVQSITGHLTWYLMTIIRQRSKCSGVTPQIGFVLCVMKSYQLGIISLLAMNRKTMENVYISQSKGLCDAIKANEGLSIRDGSMIK